MSKTEPQTGPYTSTRTVTLKFTPFELTTTVDVKASHPPATCGCGGGDKMSLEDYVNIAAAVLSKMQGGAGSLGVAVESDEPRVGSSI